MHCILCIVLYLLLSGLMLAVCWYPILRYCFFSHYLQVMFLLLVQEPRDVYVPQDKVYSIIVSWSESSACVALRLSDIGNLTISKSFLISQSLLNHRSLYLLALGGQVFFWSMVRIGSPVQTSGQK